MNRNTIKHSKLEMEEDIAKIIFHLHYGNRVLGDVFLDNLKANAVHLSSKIQQDVLMFAEQVHFQHDYDPWHKVTPEVQTAADQLISDLKLI
ncbi:MAG TPA: hypothetical protein VLE96_02520 [Chlamydiales bacterium]|nr:hypothetical protein [Chlamydiales bacterium]